jgi:hypothetical protein
MKRNRLILKVLVWGLLAGCGRPQTTEIAPTAVPPTATPIIIVAQLYREEPAVEAGVRGAQEQVIIGNQRVLV